MAARGKERIFIHRVAEYQPSSTLINIYQPSSTLPAKVCLFFQFFIASSAVFMPTFVRLFKPGVTKLCLKRIYHFE